MLVIGIPAVLLVGLLVLSPVYAMNLTLRGILSQLTGVAMAEKIPIEGGRLEVEPEDGRITWAAVVVLLQAPSPRCRYSAMGTRGRRQHFKTASLRCPRTGF